MQAHTNTHSKKELQEKTEADHIMQITVACRDVRRIRKQMKKRIEGGGRHREQKAQDLEAASLIFKRFFVVDPHCLLSTLAWPW